MRRLAFVMLFLGLTSCAHHAAGAAPAAARLVPGSLDPPPWTEASFVAGRPDAPSPSDVPPPPHPSSSDPSGAVSPPPAISPPPATTPAGQWVDTSEYAWLWIPYDRQYVYVPDDPQVFPEQYVYYPVYGWRWVIAPWVYGYGTQPNWGPAGVRAFAWYAHPWFRVGGFWGWGGYRGWGDYRGWIGPRSWGARGWAGAPAHFRTGVGERHSALAVRPAPALHLGEHERSWGGHRGGER
jgi:hypothetical protein